jgi:hypothetical protein
MRVEAGVCMRVHQSRRDHTFRADNLGRDPGQRVERLRTILPTAYVLDEAEVVDKDLTALEDRV